jgi:hypothetical protein
MKKSELKQIIKEEISRLNESEDPMDLLDRAYDMIQEFMDGYLDQVPSEEYMKGKHLMMYNKAKELLEDINDAIMP